MFWVLMLFSRLERGNQKYKKRGGQKVEQLQGKTKGGSYVSKCENYSVFVSVFVFHVCMYDSSKTL